MPDLELWQHAATELDKWACGYDAGRSKLDPIYLHVTEGRDVKEWWSKYSSCGDRAHWRMWRLGVRSPFVNREERTAQPHDWHAGVNITWLHDPSRGSPCLAKTDAQGHKYPVRPDQHWTPEPGDELLIWNIGNDAHSLSILSYDAVKGTASTANYGAGGMSPSATPGAKIAKAVPLVYTAQDGWVYGLSHKKKVQRVIKLADVIPLITAKPNFLDLSGEYIFGSGEELDALESVVA